MEFHQIRYFLAVERERNFSRAAESCNITQPALTRAIQRLEDELRGALFDRRPGHVEITELGRAMLPKFENALSAIVDAKALARSLVSERKQRLRLGMMCTLGANNLAMLISSLAEACPDIELQLTEARGPAVIAQLMMDEIDVGLVGLPRYGATLDVQPLYTEMYGVAMAREHHLANSGDIKLQQLEGERYIERLNCEFEAYFEHNHGPWPIKLDVRFKSEREDCVQALIASGFGVAIMPRSMEIRADLVWRPLVAPQVERTVSVVTIKDRELPVPATVLKQLLPRLLM